MTSVEEINSGIREKSIERESAIKRIRSDIQEKRKEIKKDVKKYKDKFRSGKSKK